MAFIKDSADDIYLIRKLQNDNERLSDVVKILEEKNKRQTLIIEEQKKRICALDVDAETWRLTALSNLADMGKLHDTLTRAQQDGTKLVLENRDLRDKVEAVTEENLRLSKEHQEVHAYNSDLNSQYQQKLEEYQEDNRLKAQRIRELTYTIYSLREVISATTKFML